MRVFGSRTKRRKIELHLVGLGLGVELLLPLLARRQRRQQPIQSILHVSDFGSLGFRVPGLWNVKVLESLGLGHVGSFGLRVPGPSGSSPPSTAARSEYPVSGQDFVGIRVPVKCSEGSRCQRRQQPVQSILRVSDFKASGLRVLGLWGIKVSESLRSRDFGSLGLRVPGLSGLSPASIAARSEYPARFGCRVRFSGD